MLQVIASISQLLFVVCIICRIDVLLRSLRRLVVVRQLLLVSSHPVITAVKVSSALLCFMFQYYVLSCFQCLLWCCVQFYALRMWTAEVVCHCAVKKRKAEDQSPVTVTKKPKSETLVTSGSSSNIASSSAAASSSGWADSGFLLCVMCSLISWMNCQGFSVVSCISIICTS